MDQVVLPPFNDDMDFDDLNYPNQLESIPDDKLKADRSNLFIAFDPMRNKLRMEVRAFPLLRPPLPITVNPKPGFISFIGEPGAGKSWVLRSLKSIRDSHQSKNPAPLVRCKRSPNSYSTSSDVHLYADGATSQSENPILFLEFEAVRDTVSFSLRASPDLTSSREWVRDAYPRIAYAFSNCLIFVAHEQLEKAYYLSMLLTSYAIGGVRGSTHRGFKPALFIVFNQMPIHDLSPSAWSIDNTTAAFLARPELKGLKEHYHKICVIKIPQLKIESSKLIIDQLQKLQQLIREQHDEACKRRISFGLNFTANEVTAYLRQALRVFTDRHDAVFDWLEQSYDQHRMPISKKAAQDKWKHFLRYFRHSRKLSPTKAFHDALAAFHSHFVFCVRRHLASHPVVGRTVETISPGLWDAIRDIDLVVSRYVPCLGVKDGRWCDRIRETHDADFHACGSERWRGAFAYDLTYILLREELLQSLTTSWPLERAPFSIKDSQNIAVLSRIRPVYSCSGCFDFPSTILSCNHAFCEDCVQVIVDDKDLHHLETVKCPYCLDIGWHFSPRFLPRTAGYRILSLDGGGVRGIAQIKILRAIEERCFGIPIVHLFDLFVGTSIGGQLILALASRQPPLTVSEAEQAFKHLIVESFKPKKRFGSFIWHFLTAFMKHSTKYKARALDTNLKDFFQESGRLLSSRNPPSPHVAVTAASRMGFEARVISNYMRRLSDDDSEEEKCVISNYMQQLSGDSGEESHRLVLSPEPKDCMPTWVAARCTAAAYPFFKGFEWNGECLLDGGFAVNCPVGLAVDEARRIWPTRTLDTLVSIGTGSSAAPQHKKPKKENLLEIAETTIDVVVSSEKQWKEFQMHHNSEMERILRLQPAYSKTFPLDAVNKLDAISREVEAWLTTQTDQIDDISNQLIASLFFFKPSALDNQSDTQSGSIGCRLPPGFFPRQALINALIEAARAHELFIVDIPGQSSSGEPFRGALHFLENLSPHMELSIPVTFKHLPLIGRSTIDIKLCDIFGNGQSRRSISGCPFSTICE